MSHLGHQLQKAKDKMIGYFDGKKDILTKYIQTLRVRLIWSSEYSQTPTVKERMHNLNNTNTMKFHGPSLEYMNIQHKDKAVTLGNRELETAWRIIATEPRDSHVNVMW